MDLKALMNNPYAWLTLSVCTILSLVFAIYTLVVDKKRKEISIDYYTNEIIKSGKSPIDGLDIKYKEKQIDNLWSTIYCIWNSGNVVIDKCDVVESRPLKLICKRGSILDVRILTQSDISNAFKVKRVLPSEAEIEFDYMDGNEGVKLQVLHTGENKELSIDIKIKGGKQIRNYTEIKKHSFLVSMLNELFPMLVFFSALGIGSICGKFLGFSIDGIGLFIFAIVVAVFMVLLYLKMKRKIYSAFHKVVPDTLKK